MTVYEKVKSYMDIYVRRWTTTNNGHCVLDTKNILQHNVRWKQWYVHLNQVLFVNYEVDMQMCTNRAPRFGITVITTAYKVLKCGTELLFALKATYLWDLKYQ